MVVIIDSLSAGPGPGMAENGLRFGGSWLVEELRTPTPAARQNVQYQARERIILCILHRKHIPDHTLSCS